MASNVTDTPQTLPANAAVPARRPVNVRSVTLGLLGVALVCSLTIFNDYVVFNTPMVGSALPLGVLLFVLVLVLGINAPLWRWKPRLALGSGELAVVLGMMLVACSIPSVGLMRYLPGHLTAFWYHSNASTDFADIMRQLDLPDWIFPAMKSDDPAVRGNDRVVRDFVDRVPGQRHTFWERFWAVPWAAWRIPAVTWGVLIGCMALTVVCLMIIFRKQWVENERLPFPLASIYLSLIEQPESGRALNSLFRSRQFWIAFMTVFAIHIFRGLSIYWPKYVPLLPLGYDLGGLFTEPPWKYTEQFFKRQDIYFTIVGLTFFLQTKLAFSLWFIFVLVQVARMMTGAYGSGVSFGMETDQLFGAMVPFGIVILWVGRHHLKMVVGQMFRRPRGGEAQGRYLPYALAGWGVAIGVLGQVAWLTLAGTSVLGAVVLVLLLMLLFLIVGRVVAETGIPYVLIPVPLQRPWIYALNDLPQAVAYRAPLRTFFFGTLFHDLFTHDTREALAPYASHALRVADTAAYEGERDWRRAAPLTLALLLALAVAFCIGGAAYLYCDYNYSVSLSREPMGINSWGATDMARDLSLSSTRQFIPPGTGSRDVHSRLGHFTFGASVSTALSVLRLRFEAWPLHPVGYLLVYTWGLRKIWFSVFIGWLIKVFILRFGGSQMFRSSRTLFIGFIIGEAAAAAFWLVTNLVLVSLGMEYYYIPLLPHL